MNAPQSPRFVSLHLPDDVELLAAFGRVAICHSHLDHQLKRVVKTLAEMKPEDADRALAYEGSSTVRRIVRRLAERNFGKGTPVTLQIMALLHRCEAVTTRRNTLLHSVVARELDGDAKLYQSDQSLLPMPTVDELNRLAADIRELVARLLDARTMSGGLIFDAMQARTGPNVLKEIKAED